MPRRPSKGFDFTAAIRAVCADMARRVPELAHIEIQRVAIGVCQTRNGAMHGVFATLTPLRFEGGLVERAVRGRRRRIQPLVDSLGQEFLYLLNFYLPRFLNLPLEEKLSTITHELWHIGPQFDGDLRRHPGRCYAHGHSQRQYDAQMDRLTQQWLALDPPHHLYEFLELTFDELAAEHGGIRGDRWPVPKILPA
jgi:Putative phage metallopeptidase